MAWLCVAWVAHSQSQAAARGWFMHAADPQIGYGDEGRGADADRFERLLRAAEQQGAQFVVVAGDLVQDRTFLQWRAFEAARAATRLPVHYVVGNHDVIDVDSLARFRDHVGADHYVAKHGDVTLIALDSEVMRSPALDAAEYEAQWAWLERTLGREACTQPGNHCLAVMHRPPFVQEVGEPETHQNWPPDTRQRLIALLTKHGIRTVLAGHLHTTGEAHDPASGLDIYVVGGTARVFDALGAGYRRFETDGGMLRQRYVRFEDFPVIEDFMGIAGWTPRLLRPSLRHWLLTLGECLVAWLAWTTARQARRRNMGWPHSTASASFRLLALSSAFLGLNEQLDIDELATALLRKLAFAQGWIGARHQVGAVVALAFVLVVLGMVGYLIARAGRARRWAALAWLAMAVPSAWFVLSTLSDHGFGMGLSLDTWDLLLFAALPAALYAVRSAHRCIAST